MVMVGVPEMVKNATSIRLDMATRSAFSAEEDNKTGTNDVSLNLFIKNEWHVICLNPKN